MKRIMMIIILFLGVFVAYGEVKCDSVKVYFALNSDTFNPSHSKYAGSMKKFIDGVVASAQSGTLDHVAVYGNASPEGPLLNNERLSIRRCDVIADYISSHARIPRGEILTFPGYTAWESLRTLVIETPQTPHREEILRVLDKNIPAASTDRSVSEQCQKDLLAIDNGLPYGWMVENLFPKLRYSLAVYSYNIAERPSIHTRYTDKALSFSYLTPPPDFNFNK